MNAHGYEGNWAWLALALLTCSGCFVRKGDEHRHVEVEAFDITPTTVAVGESFEVTWKIRHSDRPGDVFKYGLYLAEEDEIAELDDILQPGDIPKIFKSGGLVKDPGKIVCERSEANKISCSPFGSLDLSDGVGLSGEQIFTFAACVGYVLDDADLCDSRSIVLTFP